MGLETKMYGSKTEALMFEDLSFHQLPPATEAILSDTQELGFTMASERETGAMLSALAASKPGGRLLELGTGTGLGTAWLLQGMDADSFLVSVDSDDNCLKIAKRHLDADSRVRFVHQEGAEYLRESQQEKFDLIFADAWPGKFWDRGLAISLLSRGGFYVIDDLAPQPNWPPDHAQKVDVLLDELRQQSDLVCWPIAWSTGIIVGTKR